MRGEGRRWLWKRRMETRSSPSTKLSERISEIAAYMERGRSNVTLHKKRREGEEREMKRGKKKEEDERTYIHITRKLCLVHEESEKQGQAT